jgi:hypothetical protein
MKLKKILFSFGLMVFLIASSGAVLPNGGHDGDVPIGSPINS